MPRSTTITLTTAEMALLYSMVSVAMETDNEYHQWSKPMRRVANSVHAKATAALIATQKEGGS